jgi:sulfofructose kinase
VLTYGARGAHAYSPHASHHAPALVINQVDATGAGDAFTAGLLHTLLGRQDMPGALAEATAWGALAAQTRGSTPVAPGQP